jgi:hypothetical protein
LFQVGTDLGFVQPDGLWLPLDKQWGLIRVVRRVRVEGCTTVLVYAAGVNIPIAVPGGQDYEGIALLALQIPVIKLCPIHGMQQVGATANA